MRDDQCLHYFLINTGTIITRNCSSMVFSNLIKLIIFSIIKVFQRNY